MIKAIYLSTWWHKTLYFTAFMATDENAEHTCSLGENNPGSVQNGRTSSEMWSPDSWGLQNTMTIDYIQIELPWQLMSNKPFMENWSLDLFLRSKEYHWCSRPQNVTKCFLHVSYRKSQRNVMINSSGKQIDVSKENDFLLLRKVYKEGTLTCDWQGVD